MCSLSTTSAPQLTPGGAEAGGAAPCKCSTAGSSVSVCVSVTVRVSPDSAEADAIPAPFTKVLIPTVPQSYCLKR